MDHQLKAHYRGADLVLDFDCSPAAQLRINGIVRDQFARGPDSANDGDPLAEKGTVALKLASSVQTDYEWHEFVEATLNYRDNRIHAALTASGEEIASLDVNTTRE